MSAPFHRQPAADRLHRARAMQGLAVQLRWSRLRGAGAPETLVGELVSVATTHLGSGTDLAVIRVAGRAVDEAISLATVVSIEPLGARAAFEVLTAIAAGGGRSASAVAP